jgi:hypothetical protein
VAADLSDNGILELLDHGSSLKIPPFQRSFAWEEEQVNEYWSDLKRALDRDGGPAEYFLGLIVVDQQAQIQDGQQRLATTLLLASEIYDAADAAKALGGATPSLATNVIGQVTPALRTSPSAPLCLNPADQELLLKRAGIRSDSPESVRRLAKAREVLAGLVQKEMAACSTPDERLRRLKKWSEFLRKPAYVIVLTVPERDAHNIFETLNTRGVRLSNGDLVKSHLIARADDTGAAVSKWNDITAALKDDKGSYEKDLEAFLLHYYGSRYGRTVRRDLFADLRPHIADRDAQTVLNELYESAKLYRALVDPIGQTAYWAKIGAGTREAAELINGLGLRQLRYLLLAVLRDFANTESATTRCKRQAQALLKITAWSVRGLVFRQLGASEAEKVYIGAAQRIRAKTGTIDTVAKLKKWFIDEGLLNLDDALFKDAFIEYPWDARTVHTKARAILYALEYHEISNKSALTPRQTLSVEHVLPQSPAPGEWKQFTDAERDVYTFKLGNLLLIDGPSRANDSLGNKTWAEKKKLIATFGPQTPLTVKALTETTWSKTTITNRQADMADIAAKAFAT